MIEFTYKTVYVGKTTQIQNFELYKYKMTKKKQT